MILVDSQTKQPIKIGDKVHTFRGEECTVKGIRKPFHPGSTGRVFVSFHPDEFDREYFPSVINAQWIEDEKQ